MPANTRNSAKSTGRTTNTPEQLTQPVTPPEVNSPILDLFNGGADITIRSREDLKKHLSVPASADDVLIALLCMFKQQKEREDVLVERVASLTEKVTNLEDRLLRSEAYSGRNTIILGGIPDQENESPQQLESKVIKALKSADPTIRPEDFGIIHRNRAKVGSEAARTTTVVFNRARQKDNIMRKQGRTKLKKIDCLNTCPPRCSEHRGVSAWHRLSPALADRKKELESVQGVEWVAFSGHRMFTVCYDKDKFKHNVVNVRELAS